MGEATFPFPSDLQRELLCQMRPPCHMEPPKPGAHQGLQVTSPGAPVFAGGSSQDQELCL